MDDASQQPVIVSPDVRVVRLSNNSGVAIARNAGVAAAVGEIIVFIDDDCTAQPTWLEQLIAPIEQQRFDFSFGRTEYIRPGYRGYFPERLVTNQGGRWPGAGNFAIRKSVCTEVGGFDPAFLYFHNEDTELAIRLVSAKKTFTRVPSAEVIHAPATWTVQSLLASARNAAVWPRLRRQYPLHYRTFGADIFGPVVSRQEFIAFWLWPIVVPLMFIRYLLHGQRKLGIFFTKWPVFIIIRRFAIWRESWRQKVLMI